MKRMMTVLALGIGLALAAPAAMAQWGWQQDRDHDRNDDRDRGRASYQQGLQQGRMDAEHNVRTHRERMWKNDDDRRAFESGYDRGYRDAMANRGGYGGRDDRRGTYGNGTYGNGPYNNGPYGNGPYGNGRNGNGPYGNGTYGAGNSGYGMNSARQVGFQDGMNDGAKDRSTGHSFRPTNDDKYKHADRGYNSSFGGKQQYKDTYRQGYSSGYQRGYYGR